MWWEGRSQGARGPRSDSIRCCYLHKQTSTSPLLLATVWRLRLCDVSTWLHNIYYVQANIYLLLYCTLSGFGSLRNFAKATHSETFNGQYAFFKDLFWYVDTLHKNRHVYASNCQCPDASASSYYQLSNFSNNIFEKSNLFNRQKDLYRQALVQCQLRIFYFEFCAPASTVHGTKPFSKYEIPYFRSNILFSEYLLG